MKSLGTEISPHTLRPDAIQTLTVFFQTNTIAIKQILFKF